MHKISLLLSLLISVTANAQAIILIAPQQCDWHAGDDMRWALPGLDETGWKPWSEWKPDFENPHLWVRCHLDLSSLRDEPHPAIQVSLYSAYQLYLDGVRIGGEGNLENGNSSLDAIQSYAAPSQLLTSQPATVALRITNRMTLSNSGPFRGLIDVPLQLRAGDASLLDALRAHTALTRATQFAPTAISFGIIGVLAIVLLGLFLYDRSRTDLLMLSSSCISLAALRINEFAAASMLNYSVSAGLVILGLGNIGLTVTEVPFFYKLARRRIPKFIIAVLLLIGAAYIPTWMDALYGANQPTFMGPMNKDIVRPFSLLAHVIISFVPFFVFAPYRAIPARMRPLAILCMLWGAADTIWFLVETTGLPIPGVPDLFARWGLTLLAVRAFTTACVLTALLALLFREQRQVAEERAEMAGEMQAASRVQQYLIPEHLPSTPGLTIASVYHPAREVGGDFFQVLPQQDGSVLIVVGDMAGKGLEAGMLATLIVGAIRTAAEFTPEPQRILSLLNQRLQGRGLATCLALLIQSDGSTTLVNAGHLPPYLNGREMAMEGALPLGAIAGIEFPAQHFQLAARDQLTLMTDGIVEAQDAEGNLFGFDRIAEMLRDGISTAALATSAQAYGQEDDITVLTIERMAPTAAS